MCWSGRWNEPIHDQPSWPESDLQIGRVGHEKACRRQGTNNEAAVPETVTGRPGLVRVYPSGRQCRDPQRRAAARWGMATWPRDSYAGPGGGLYTGPGGGLYVGPGGGASVGPGGGLSVGPGGGLSVGPGGGLSVGPGGGLSVGPGGGLSVGPGGGMSVGPGGGLSVAPGGGLYTGSSSSPYHSNWPPRSVLLEHLERLGLTDIARTLRTAWGM
jgi:hypothetical protein